MSIDDAQDRVESICGNLFFLFLIFSLSLSYLSDLSSSAHKQTLVIFFLSPSIYVCFTDAQERVSIKGEDVPTSTST